MLVFYLNNEVKMFPPTMNVAREESILDESTISSVRRTRLLYHVFACPISLDSVSKSFPLGGFT